MRTEGRTNGRVEERTDRQTREGSQLFITVLLTRQKNWSAIPLYSSKSILIRIHMFTVGIYFQTGYQSRL